MVDYEMIRLTADNFQQFKTIFNPKNIERFNKRMDYWYGELSKDNRITFIYSLNGEFLGEAALVFDYRNIDSEERDYTIPNQRICLIEMTVKESYRNRGIGGNILDFLFKCAKELGYVEMSLGVDLDNYNAKHLYEKKGFTEIIFKGEDEGGKYIKLLKKL